MTAQEHYELMEKKYNAEIEAEALDLLSISSLYKDGHDR